jgi:chromosome segregation ATPase
LVPLKQVIRISKDYATAVEEALPQLSAAFVTSSFDRAVQLGRQFPQLVFLSPDGDVVRGRLVSGGGKPAVGHLTLKREIRDLQRKAGLLERSIAEQQEKQEVLQQAITEREESLLEVRQTAQELEKNLFATDLRLKQILNELDRLGQRQNLAALELQRTESEKAQALVRRTQCTETISTAQRRQEVLLPRNRRTGKKDLSRKPTATNYAQNWRRFGSANSQQKRNWRALMPALRRASSVANDWTGKSPLGQLSAVRFRPRSSN